MKIVFCLVLVIVGAFAERCHDDNDCNTTVCDVGFRVDCDHIDHKHIDTHLCTCKATDDHHCKGDDWCALNMHKHCDRDEGKTWHCSSRDHRCQCYCDHLHGKCDDK